MSDLEKDQTVRRSNRIAGLPPSPIDLPLSPSSSDSSFKIEEEVVDMEQTLRQLAAPVLDQQSLCIEIDNSIELKSGLIHQLPKFSGLAGHDPHQHLKEFHMVVLGMK